MPFQATLTTTRPEDKPGKLVLEMRVTDPKTGKDYGVAAMYEEEKLTRDDILEALTAFRNAIGRKWGVYYNSNNRGPA